jgi:hypothetical protein
MPELEPVNEEKIKADMRLFALESVVCQHLAMIYQTMPREHFDFVKRQAIEGTKRHTFAGADAPMSGLLSSELQTAIQRLYGMIQHHLDAERKKKAGKA